MKSIVLAAALMFAGYGSAQNGEFQWDARWDPESANNMCYAMYCLGRGETFTYGGGGRSTNGDDSGQKVHPVANHVAYNLNFPSLWATISILVQGAMRTVTQRLIVADEWPPASALEGGQGAALRATTRQDSNGQGPRVSQMWAARNTSNNRVHVTPVNYLWSDSSGHFVNAKYCACKGLTGSLLRVCCDNDGYQFQKDPNPKNPPSNGKDYFFFNNLDNFIRPKPGPFKAALEVEERATVEEREANQEEKPASVEARTPVTWAA